MQNQNPLNQIQRQIIAAAIDREAITQQLSDSKFIPAYDVIPPGFPQSAEPFLDRYGIRNIDLSRRLLREAGYSETQKWDLDIWYPSDPFETTDREIVELIKKQLEETGLINVNLNSLPSIRYEEYMQPMGIRRASFKLVDPSINLASIYSCSQLFAPGLPYCHPQLERLMDLAASGSEAEAELSPVQQVGQVAADEVVVIPILWEQSAIAYQTGIEGIVIGPRAELYYPGIKFTEQAQPSSGSMDSIIIGITGEVFSLDPVKAKTQHDWEILINTGIPLLTYTPGTTDLVPGMLSNYPAVSEDGMTYTFFLRDDIRFADGTQFRAQMYVSHWERLVSLESEMAAGYQDIIDRIESQGDLTIMIYLRKPTKNLPAIIASVPMIVSNPNQFPRDETVDFPARLDGLGVYRVVSHEPGEEMVLETNPFNVLQPPHIPIVILRYFPDSLSLSNALESRKIDIAWMNLDSRELNHLDTLEGIEIESYLIPSLRYLAFSPGAEPAADQP